MKDLKKNLIEGLVILISVLAAFWLEDFRENRNDNIQLQGILTLLEIEIIANEKLVDSVVNQHQKIIEAINNSHKNNSTFGFHTEAVIDMANFKPHTSSLQTLYNSGLLGKIEGKELQIQISAWDEYLAELIEHERWSLEIRNETRKHIANFRIRIDQGNEENELNKDIVILNFLTLRRAEEVRAVESALRFKDYLTKTRLAINGYLSSSGN